MPSIKFSKKYLIRMIGEEMEDSTLSSYISKLGFEAAEITKDEITVEITPNRPELLDAVGFARAMRYFLHKKKGFSYLVEDAKPAAEIKVERSVSRVRPYISGLVATGLSFDDEMIANLINFTDKLCDVYGRARRKMAIGIHDLNKITGPLTYTLRREGSFRALNAESEKTYAEIIRTTGQGLKYYQAIGEHVGAYPVLEDEKGAIALIPIINSERTRLSHSTKNILVDITGTSEYVIDKFPDVIACSLIDMGAKVGKLSVNYGQISKTFPLMEKRKITINLADAEREIGMKIGASNIISLANKAGYEAYYTGKKVTFEIPEYRTDVLNYQDVVEDIAIAYGYDYINPSPVLTSSPGSLAKSTYTVDRLAMHMVGLGFSEMMNTLLTNEHGNYELMGLHPDKEYIKLKNPKAENLTMLRTWLLPSLLKNVSMSLTEKMPYNLFEIDSAFGIGGDALHEDMRICAVSTDSRANFNDAKAIFLSINSSFAMGLSLSEASHGSFIQGRCAYIKKGGKTVGILGELHPKVLAGFKIEEPTTCLEINLSDTLGI
jgi:phenylalanyl-tRNA synthetase beta chain